MKIEESFNNKTKQFILKGEGHIESVYFRECCLYDFGIEVFKVEHCFESGVPITIGYSKKVY